MSIDQNPLSDLTQKQMATTMNTTMNERLKAAQEKYRQATEALRRAENLEKTARRELQELRRLASKESVGAVRETKTVRVWNNLTGQHDYVEGNSDDEGGVQAY